MSRKKKTENSKSTEKNSIQLTGSGPSSLNEGPVYQKNGNLYIEADHYENLNRQARNLSLLMDSARSIMGEMDLDSLLRLIMDKVTRVMHADRSTLFILDPEKGELWSRVAQGTDTIRVPLGMGIAGSVAKSGKPLNIPEAYDDPRFNRDFDVRSGYRTKTILCMPVKNPLGEIVGVIQVLNRQDGLPFNQSDEELLDAFSSLAGISIANAQAYDELQKEKGMLEVRVKERTKDLVESQKKTDALLLNILPSDIASELKASGRAETRSYEKVSVLFSDFKGFTSVAENLSAEDLVKELDRYFYFFDEITERFNLEKIKTIGDAYMCAGGIPTANESNPVEAVLAAISIQKFVEEMKSLKVTLDQPAWELRIGVHTGPIIAGVVGMKKFAYDIWGDAVNIAARMESSGEPGHVNVSSTTYEQIKDFFQCTHRGRVPAKNKGEIDMYFVDRIHPHLSADSEGYVPSDHFFALFKKVFGHHPGWASRKRKAHLDTRSAAGIPSNTEHEIQKKPAKKIVKKSVKKAAKKTAKKKRG